MSEFYERYGRVRRHARVQWSSQIEEAVLALLGALELENVRAWKRYDFDVMESLLAQGLISDPHSRADLST